MTHRRHTRMLAILHGCLLAGTVSAQTLGDRDVLTGNWGGRRPDGPLQLEWTYAGDLAGVADGGLRRGTTYLDNVGLTFALDLEAWRGWSGWRASATGLGNHGGDPSADRVGDARGVDNTEAVDAWRLYQFWLQRQAGPWSLRAGLYDLNSEFDANDTGALFLHSSHGIGADLAQSGPNGPSIFPYTSVGVRLLRASDTGRYLQPDLQYVVRPDGRSGTDDALVWLLHLEASL